MRKPRREEIDGIFGIRDEMAWAGERMRRTARRRARFLVARQAAARLPAPVLMTAFTAALLAWLSPSPFIAPWFPLVMAGWTAVSWALWAWEVRDLARRLTARDTGDRARAEGP